MVMSGHWRCPIKRRASQRRANAKWHRSIEGILSHRRYRLRKLKERTLEQLTNLKKERP